MDAIPDGVRVIREDFSVVAANREFLRQSGLDFDQALAAPCYASSHGRKESCVPTLVVCPLAALAESDEPVRCMHVHRRQGSKDDFPVEVIAAPLTIETRDGSRRFVVEAIRDLTQTMAVSQEQRLSEIGQLATGVAHEIHNPLASIRFGLSALEAEIGRKPDPGEALGYLKLVAAEVERCIDITGRLMRLSQSQGGPGTLIDLGDVARDVASLLSYESMTRRVELAIRGFEDGRVVASQADLGMALINLVQNAFHATPEFGVVAVEGRTVEGRVIIEVSDSGCGIAPANLPRIFQPFWTHRADQTAGSGLGLPITKAIVERWGGTIAVRSRLGEGSTFTISLPHAEAALGG
jgi:signal transduction histidine kinase